MFSSSIFWIGAAVVACAILSIVSRGFYEVMRKLIATIAIAVFAIGIVIFAIPLSLFRYLKATNNNRAKFLILAMAIVSVFFVGWLLNMHNAFTAKPFADTVVENFLESQPNSFTSPFSVIVKVVLMLGSALAVFGYFLIAMREETWSQLKSFAEWSRDKLEDYANKDITSKGVQGKTNVTRIIATGAAPVVTVAAIDASGAAPKTEAQKGGGAFNWILHNYDKVLTWLLAAEEIGNRIRIGGKPLIRDN